MILALYELIIRGSISLRIICGVIGSWNSCRVSRTMKSVEEMRVNLDT